MSRKAKQIAIMPTGAAGDFFIVAVAEDGTMWKKHEPRGDLNSKPWIEIPGLPAAVSDEDFDEMLNNPINR